MKKLLVSIVTICAISTSLIAESSTPEEINERVIESARVGVNIGLKAGTLGLGVDISKSINKWVSIRLNANGFKYTKDERSAYSDIIQSEKEYKLQTLGLLVDYHLLQFRLTTGIYLNKNQYTEKAIPKDQEDFNFNGINYNTSQIESFTSTISFEEVSPYIGIGWGNNANREGWNVTFDIGLMYHGNPSIELDIVTNSPVPAEVISRLEFDANAQKEIEEADLADFPFYPVVMIGVNYSF